MACYLEPAFVVDAMPVHPDSAGGYTLTGRDAGGRELFAVSFAMPVVADADEGTGGFVYHSARAGPGGKPLASVTLRAPDGRTAVLDGSTDRPMTILRDAATGRVRAFLHGVDSAAQGGRDSAASGLGGRAGRGGNHKPRNPRCSSLASMNPGAFRLEKSVGSRLVGRDGLFARTGA